MILLAGGGYGYYIASSYMAARTDDYTKKLADMQMAQDKIDQLQDLKSQLKKLQGDIQLIETALPRTAQQTELTLQLQSLAVQSGMSISQISFPTAGPATGAKTAAKQDPIQNFIANFNLEGSYSKLQNFLQRQEQLNRYTNVTNLSISKDQKSQNLIFTINLYAYIKP